MPCDGADNDVCADGVIVCTSPSTTTCNDTLANDPERCDTFDNDCDGNTDEGFNLGMACDGGDADQCAECRAPGRAEMDVHGCLSSSGPGRNRADPTRDNASGTRVRVRRRGSDRGDPGSAP